MPVKQISVFLPNSVGALSEVTSILADNNINIRALSLADTTDFGILRLIVCNPEKAADVLHKNNITVKSSDVTVIAINDEPNALNKVLTYLTKVGVSIEYMYAFAGHAANVAYAVVKTNDAQLTAEALAKENIKALAQEDIYEL